MDSQLLQVAQIRWDRARRITQAEGACHAVFHADTAALLQKSLVDVLGVSANRIGELEAAVAQTSPAVAFVYGVFARETRVFRFVLRPLDDGFEASVVDLDALLEGAPPLQIAKLSSSLSHEIRNPLSSVKMAIQTVARNPGLSERDQRRLAIANREVRTMERMLWLLSEYGRDTFPSLEVHSLKVVVQEAVALISPELLERKIQVQIQEEGDPPRARVDITRFRPVLAQLLMNVATGHAEGASVVVWLKPGPSQGGQIQIDDPSTPLATEELARVFEPFASMLARGAGLSLAALFQVMKWHDGAIRAEAYPPGTRYTLTFPPV